MTRVLIRILQPIRIKFIPYNTNILVCNDDGVSSEGIYALAKCLSKEHNVLVVAPNGNRSAYAHSLSIGKDIEVEQVYIDAEFESYAVTGTPADCVKFAKHILRSSNLI